MISGSLPGMPSIKPLTPHPLSYPFPGWEGLCNLHAPRQIPGSPWRIACAPWCNKRCGFEEHDGSGPPPPNRKSKPPWDGPSGPSPRLMQHRITYVRDKRFFKGVDGRASLFFNKQTLLTASQLGSQVIFTGPDTIALRNNNVR